MKRIISYTFSLIISVGCASKHIIHKDVILTDKEKVIALLKSFESKDTQALQYLNPEMYVQHNLGIGNGVEGLRTLITNVPVQSKVHVSRILQDGNYVIVHSEYHTSRHRIGFDIFRFDKGLIVEHWDNLQAVQPLNPGGHSMIDGPATIEDRDKTNTNKDIARAAVTEVFINRHFERLPFYFLENYREHNPSLPDSIKALGDALQEQHNGKAVLQYSSIHLALGEGNFVLVASAGQFNGHSAGLYDLFRIENSKVAERWTAFEEIPPVENRKNKNEKF